MADSLPVLAPRTRLQARLHGIEYTSGNVAAVTFEIWSVDHLMEDKSRFRTLVCLGVKLNGRGRTDYEGIVAEAARKLARDLSQMATDITETHSLHG